MRSVTRGVSDGKADQRPRLQSSRRPTVQHAPLGGTPTGASDMRGSNVDADAGCVSRSGENDGRGNERKPVGLTRKLRAVQETGS